MEDCSPFPVLRDNRLALPCLRRHGGDAMAIFGRQRLAKDSSAIP